MGKKVEDGKVWYLVRWQGSGGAASWDDEDTWEEAASLGEDEWLVSEWEQDQEADDDVSKIPETVYLTTVQRTIHHSDQTSEDPCHVFVISFESYNKQSTHKKIPLGLAVESEEMTIY